MTSSQESTSPGSTNPLTEADPLSLDALFSADPLTLTDADIDRMVARLRSERAKWASQEAKPKGGAKREKVTVTLKDLGL